MMKRIFLTGATSGIGEAAAHRFLKEGNQVIACGRRLEKLETLSAHYPGQVYPLAFDITDRKAVEQAISSLPETWKVIDVLINNAGNAHGLDFSQEASIDDWEEMIDLNLKGLLYCTRMLIPNMVLRKAGQVINISSIAGKEVYPKGNVYCAVKHAVSAFTEGLRMDLNPYGIRVSAVHPGLVETAFSEVRFKGDTERASSVYKGYQPLKAEDIAEVLHYIITVPPHVAVTDITLLPTAQASATLVNKTI